GARVDVLLRGQHAGGGRHHLDLRPDQRDAALRPRPGRPGLVGSTARRRRTGPGSEHARRSVVQRRRGGGPRAADRSGRGGARLSPVRPAALHQAVRTYLDHLVVERGLAPNSVASYRRDLRRYVAHLDTAGINDLEAVRETDVLGFLARLREGDEQHPPLSATSAGRAVVAVRGLHKFALRDGLTTHDPAADVRPPPPPKRLPKALSMHDVEALLAAAGDAGTGLAMRDRALLEVLYGTGARISEAVGLDLDDLDLT